MPEKTGEKPEKTSQKKRMNAIFLWLSMGFLLASCTLFAMGVMHIGHISVRAVTKEANENPASAMTGTGRFLYRPKAEAGDMCRMRIQFDIVDKKGRGLFTTHAPKEPDLAYYGCSPLEMEQVFTADTAVFIHLELTMLPGDIKGENGVAFDPEKQKLRPRFIVEPMEGRDMPE